MFGSGNFTWNRSSEKVGEVLRRKGTVDLLRKLVSGKTFAGRIKAGTDSLFLSLHLVGEMCSNNIDPGNTVNIEGVGSLS